MNEQTLIDIVERLRSRFYGKYRGTVTEVDDDHRAHQGPGARRARRPARPAGACRACRTRATDAGIAFLPEEGSGVWIEFEGGDVSYPIWVGCYWHDGRAAEPRRSRR